MAELFDYIQQADEAMHVLAVDLNSGPALMLPTMIREAVKDGLEMPTDRKDAAAMAAFRADVCQRRLRLHSIVSNGCDELTSASDTYNLARGNGSLDAANRRERIRSSLGGT